MVTLAGGLGEDLESGGVVVVVEGLVVVDVVVLLVGPKCLA